jgi:hypothetical protein
MHSINHGPSKPYVSVGRGKSLPKQPECPFRFTLLTNSKWNVSDHLTACSVYVQSDTDRTVCLYGLCLSAEELSDNRKRVRISHTSIINSANTSDGWI